MTKYKGKYIFARKDGGFQLRFGKISLYFDNEGDAIVKLHRLVTEKEDGTLDLRDYQKSKPLGFKTQANKYLELKKDKIKPDSFKCVKRYINWAIAEWGDRNIKTIREGDIEDFIFVRSNFYAKRKRISGKTRNDLKTYVKELFKFVARRERIEIPEFPETPFELGWRNITDLETQQDIINEVKRISYHINPKIWIGIKFLADYIICRPGELIKVREKDINLRNGSILIRDPKDKKPKLIYLTETDIEILKDMPRGMPNLYFFRHPPGTHGAKPGKSFSNTYLLRYWKKACKNLGVEGLDLYGGTRHTTATALGQYLTPEEIQGATGHASDAFKRYFQTKQARALKVTKRVQELRGEVVRLDETKKTELQK